MLILSTQHITSYVLGKGFVTAQASPPAGELPSQTKPFILIIVLILPDSRNKFQLFLKKFLSFLLALSKSD